MHAASDETRSNADSYRLRAASGAGPVDAGFGLVHADTIVATADDELSIEPSQFRFELAAGNKETNGSLGPLGLEAGSHKVWLTVFDGDRRVEAKEVPLLIVDRANIVRTFGARYGSLEYDMPVVTGHGKTTQWSSLWKTGEAPDLVVDFESPAKFVLWRGMSYAPAWALDNVMTANFFAETVEPGVFRDCCEMMSDRRCVYTHTRLIHSSPARAVIHWRYPLVDSAYTVCRDQWVDEMYFVYPDAVAVRNVTIHLDPKDEQVWRFCPQTGRRIPCSMIGAPRGKRTFNDMELITVNPAGASSQRITPVKALTILDTHDVTQPCAWPEPPDFGKSLDAYIFRMNYRSRPGVFVASHGRNMHVRLQPNTGMRYQAGALVADDRWVQVGNLPSLFADHIHWPVTRGYGTTPLTDPSQFLDRPTHTFLGYANNAPVSVAESGAVTWSWLCGIAPDDDARLRTLVAEWLTPSAVDGAQYDPLQRAYRVQPGQADLALSADLNRPTFILEGCRSVHPRLNGRAMDVEHFAVGVERTIKGVETIVTFRGDLPSAGVLTFGGETHAH